MLVVDKVTLVTVVAVCEVVSEAVHEAKSAQVCTLAELSLREIVTRRLVAVVLVVVVNVAGEQDKTKSPPIAALIRAMDAS